MTDGLALKSEAHTVGLCPSFWVPGSFSPGCWETIDFRTIVKDGKNVMYVHRNEQDLMYALKHGAKKLRLP